MAQKLLIIVGPTSSGKTALSIELAKRFDGEIISADSRQVYRGLDIGTGKVTTREMRGIPHHLLDIAAPGRTFTAHQFKAKARAAIRDIAKRGTLPIVAGGTGFYIDALVGRVQLADVPADPELRRRYANTPAAELFALLQRADRDRAASIDPHNRVRLIRALEIAQTSDHAPKPTEDRPRYDALWIGLEVPKDELERNIDARLRARMRQGMLAEAKRLHAQGLSYKRMEALGLEYRSTARHLQGKITRKEMTAELSRAIKQYAKRQRTYWRRNKDIQWFQSSNTRDIETAAKRWLKE